MKAKIYQGLDTRWHAFIFYPVGETLQKNFASAQEAFDWVWGFDIEELVVWK